MNLVFWGYKLAGKREHNTMDKDCERSRIFFCDFDGTISVEDIGHNLVKGVSKNFNQLNPKRIDFVPRSALI
jgi:hypothetical protein